MNQQLSDSYTLAVPLTDLEKKTFAAKELHRSLTVMRTCAYTVRIAECTEKSMSKPTKEQIEDAVVQHLRSVGKANASAMEVAIRLDAEHPGMSNKEFLDLMDDLAPLITTARNEGSCEIWT